IEEATLARIRQPDEHDARQFGLIIAASELLREPLEFHRGSGQRGSHFIGRDELNVILDKVESGLEICKQVEQFIAQSFEWPGQPAGELSQSVLELPAAARIDHAEHRFGLSQVDSPRQKGAQRELARLGVASARRAYS